MVKRLLRSARVLNPLRGLRYVFFQLGNVLRRRVRHLDYITLALPPAIPALPERRGWLQRRIQGDPPLSLAELDKLFEQIGADPRPKGVIIMLRGLDLSLADMQTLRDSIARLRAQGKRVIFYAQSYDTAMYYVASAGDEIILQPGGLLMTLGLVLQPTFFKNALDAVGVQLDSIAISPYKGAFDTFTREDISPEGQQQLNWLLDSRYDLIIEGIAQGRGLSAEGARALIDHAPYIEEDALAAGYVDAVMNEEGLVAHLGTKHLVPLDKAKKALLRQWRKRHDQYIAVLPLSGTIIPGESRKPPVNLPIPFIGGEMMGDETVVRQVRNLMQDKRAAAVVLWIDSGGGSGAASEAMAAALDELAQDRPVVAYMNGVAASGGYYIATPARWIVAQPGTITGSIGVIIAKAITGELYGKLRLNRLEFTRGANAGLMSDTHPFSDSQRAQMRRQVEHFYTQFVQRVAKSRQLTPEVVDTVAGGRVWTGQQALTHKLVDEMGDLHTAISKARQLANLPADTPFGFVQGKRKPLPPQIAEQANPAAALTYAHDNLRLIANLQPQYLMPLDVD